MKNFTYQRIDPIVLIKDYFPDINIGHIKYDPNLTKRTHKIVQTMTHDGTAIFTNELFYNVLKEVVFGPKCTIGYLKHMVVYGKVWLPISSTHKYLGQRERVTLNIIK